MIRRRKSSISIPGRIIFLVMVFNLLLIIPTFAGQATGSDDEQLKTIRVNQAFSMETETNIHSAVDAQIAIDLDMYMHKEADARAIRANNEVHESESNNSINSADNIAVDDYVFGKFSSWSDLDYYRLLINRSGKITILGLSGDNGCYSAMFWLCLVDSNDKIVKSSQLQNGSSGGKFQVVSYDVTPGTYYILAMTRDNYNTAVVGQTYAFKAYMDATATPTYAAINPKVDYAKMFAYSGSIPGHENRNFATRFAKSKTDILGFELALDYSWSGAKVPFTLKSVWHKPDGSTKTFTDQYNLLNTSYGSYHAWGFKASDLGYNGGWEPGTYMIDLYADGIRIISTDKFEVYDDTIPAQIKVTSVTLNRDSLPLKVGGEFQLIANINPVSATNKKVSWRSNQPAVASVDAYGKVSALSSGTAMITVTTEDGGFTDSCQVDVSSSGSTPVFLDWNAKIDQPTNQPRVITFNQSVKQSAISDSIYISTDPAGSSRVSGVLPVINPSNNKQVRIDPPVGGWQAGSTYYLFVNANLVSANNTPLKNGVRMKFTIQASAVQPPLPGTPMSLSTTTFTDGGCLPLACAYSLAGGANVSPALSWANVPEGTKSLALLVYDLSPAANSWVHWAVVGIPPTVSRLPEGASRTAQMPSGAVELKNSFGEIGYGGPCPPAGTGVHPYKFVVYALNSNDINYSSINTGNPDQASSMVSFFNNMAQCGGGLGQASIIGTYGK